MPNDDPIASLRPFEVTLELNGHRITFPAWTAGDWLEVLLGGHVDTDELLEKAGLRDAVLDLILDGELSEADLIEGLLEVIEVAAGGRRWWEVTGLLGFMEHGWATIHGKMLLAGVDVYRMPLAGFLDALYFLAVEHMDTSTRTQFDTQISLPPVGVDEPLVDEEAESQAFLNMMNASR